MNGKGVLVWPNGKMYEGGYLNDNREGFGRLTWPDGSVYEGLWKNGKKIDGKIITQGELLDTNFLNGTETTL